MTQVAPNILPTITHQVYVRHTHPSSGGSGQPPVNGESNGWEVDYNLRCDLVGLRMGSNPGFAQIRYISDTGALPQFQDVLTAYHPDDQVRVVVQTIDSQIGLGADAADLAVFEGFLGRQPFRSERIGLKEREDADFLALATACATTWIAPTFTAHCKKSHRPAHGQRWQRNGGE